MYAYVRHGLLHGQSHQQIADALGISVRSLRTAIYRHDRDLNGVPEDLVLLQELAAQWGTHIEPCRRYCLFRGVTLRRVMGRWDAVSREDAARLSAGRVDAVSERPPGHHTVAELAAIWGVGDEAARVRVKHCPYLHWARPGIKRWVRLYDLRDVHSPAPLPRSIPNGYMNREEMAAFAHRKKGAVARWVRQGCPAGRTRDGHLYFDPQAVAAWLAQHGGNVLTRRLGTRLLERLNPQERAA